MEPVDTPTFSHDQPGRTGVLLVNLGTPTAPTAAAVRPFLREFLSDRRVVDLPRWLWLPILHGIILRTRPRKSAAAYREVWTEQGSPLLVHTRDQAQALGAMLAPDWGDGIVIDHAFRYGEPSIARKVEDLRERGARRLLALPLFPQYSSATTGSVFDALSDKLQTLPWVPELHFVTHYHDHPLYIAALAGAVRDHWQVHGRADRLLLSYHGIPVRYRDRGDPYFCQCHKTTRLLAEALGLGEGECDIAFQSRFGREEWLQPYTDELLREWAAQGVSSVQVMCPGFAADCLETLEEIGMQYRRLFLDSGGAADFQYIPALNAGGAHVELLAALVRDQLSTKGHSAVTV